MSRKIRGFTIVEASLGLTLLTIGLLGLAGAFSQIVACDKTTAEKQTALLLANAKLIQLCQMPVEQIHVVKGQFEKPFENYSWQAWINASLASEDTLDIHVEVRHSSGTAAGLWTQAVGTNGQ